MLTDTHSHLYWDSFKDDLDDVIKRSIDAGVTMVINVGVDLELSQKALDQVENQLSKYPILTAYSTIGIHPHEALRYTKVVTPESSDSRDKLEEDIKKLEEIYIKNPEKIVAVGECGLDFAFDRLDGLEGMEGLEVEEIKIWQRKLFQAQIDLAKKLDLPLIVHCRDDRLKNPENTEAWNEVLNMIGNHPAILHCYSGLPHTTNYILGTTNLLVSFAATLTYPKNEYLREAAKILPLEKIVLETDCPFLPPQSKRGQRNEPSTVLEIAQLIAHLKGTTLQKISTQTTQNSKKIFKLEY